MPNHRSRRLHQRERFLWPRSSIRNLLVHIANTYEFWIARTALGMDLDYTEYASCKDMQDVMALFENADRFMQEFIGRAKGSNRAIEYEIDGKRGAVEPIKLFTHVMTHEYHHKGQFSSLPPQECQASVRSDILRVCANNISPDGQ